MVEVMKTGTGSQAQASVTIRSAVMLIHGGHGVSPHSLLAFISKKSGTKKNHQAGASEPMMPGGNKKTGEFRGLLGTQQRFSAALSVFLLESN